MPVFAGEPQVVGKGRGDPQIDAPRGRLPPQEIGLHVHIAVAEQDHVEAPAAFAHIRLRQRRAGGPIGLAALLGLAPQPLQHLGGVAAVIGAQFLRNRGEFRLRRLVGEDAALDQGGESAGALVCGQFPGRGEEGDHLGQLAVDHQSQMAQRMDHQHAVVRHGRQMDEAG